MTGFWFSPAPDLALKFFLAAEVVGFLLFDLLEKPDSVLSND
jgi:hypothetical protein